MNPPKYDDLNLPARQIITKGFKYGMYKVENNSGSLFRGFVAFNAEAETLQASLTMLNTIVEDAGVFLKTNIAGDCVSFSDMQLSTKITFQDTHMKGLKLSYGISYMPVIGKKAAAFKATYKTMNSLSSANLTLDFTGPFVSLAHVHRILDTNWYLGVKYDKMNQALSFEKSLAPLSLSLAYLSRPLSASVSLSHNNILQVTTHKQLTDNLSAALICDWSGNLRIGSAYKCPYGLLKLKANSRGLLSGSFEFDLIPKFSLSLNTQWDVSHSSIFGNRMGMTFKLAG